jgi:hypothetical protein
MSVTPETAKATTTHTSAEQLVTEFVSQQFKDALLKPDSAAGQRAIALQAAIDKERLAREIQVTADAMLDEGRATWRRLDEQAEFRRQRADTLRARLRDELITVASADNHPDYSKFFAKRFVEIAAIRDERSVFIEGAEFLRTETLPALEMHAIETTISHQDARAKTRYLLADFREQLTVNQLGGALLLEPQIAVKDLPEVRRLREEGIQLQRSADEFREKLRTERNERTKS